MLRIERSPWIRIGISRTLFDQNYVLKDEADPFIPNSTIPRARPIALSERARGFGSDEIDRIIKAMFELRDTMPFVPPKPVVAAEHHPSKRVGPKRNARAKARRIRNAEAYPT
jgi:hypothetical protein